MLQKNCENEIRELSRDQQEMLDEHIDRLNKVFKGKDNYAGIAVMSEKYAPVVRENKEAYPLNEIQVIIKKNGEPFVRCSWKSDEGTSNFPLQFSAKTSKCPVFDSFLKQITHGNPQLEERFWMAIGYLMIYPARGKFFIVMGYARDSGKSVLGNFVQRLYPKESVGNLRLQEMKGTFSSMSFLNAVINLELDMPNAKLNAEVASRLKQITGGDSITVQRKYLSPVTLTRRIKFVFAGNYPLCIDGEDDALQKRIVFLPFDESIPDDQQDPYLEDKIWDERDAVVTKSLHYARKLVKLNYKFPEIPQVDDAKCIVRDSIAKTVGKFVQESCDMSEPKAVTATEDLYNAYLDYCKEKDMWACSQTVFTKGLTQMGLNHTRSRCTGEDMIVRKNPVSAFQGIKLRP